MTSYCVLKGRHQLKFPTSEESNETFSENSKQELSENTIYIDFGQVFQSYGNINVI